VAGTVDSFDIICLVKGEACRICAIASSNSPEEARVWATLLS